ncbi:MAG TPA: TonB-dependent receptor [Sphingomicrobium sp.]|nr:TonB-dependent receptor [Sphingomicrobium sp.]
MKLDFRQRLLSTTLLVGASMIASPAFAQAAPPPAPVNPPDNSAVPTTPVTTAPQVAAGVPSTNANGVATTNTQEIVVTGSRIPQPNLETASPVTTVTSQEVKLSGTTRTEDLVNSLPQVFAAQGSNVSNGASGTAEVDLRGLGAKRNLVLVNGKRLQPGDTSNPVADINFIPNQLIKRVDVLTGGASSVYGADAVAGVINFIMDTTFTGFRIDGQASVFQHNNSTDKNVLAANAARGFLPPHGNVVNGGAQDASAMFGAAFDDGRGHVVAYATYRSQDPILESTRDYSFCTLAALPQHDSLNKNGTINHTSIDSLGRSFNCGGSGTSANGTFLTNVGTFQVQGNKFVPGSTPFNFAPFNYFQRPDERYNFGTFADYEIAPGAHPYLEAMFMDDHTDAQIAPSGDFGNTTTLNCDNPLLSAQERATICQAAVFNPADTNPTFKNGKPVFKSNFGNLVGQNPIFITDANGNVIGLSGFTAPTLFPNGSGGTFNEAHVYPLRRNVEGGGRDDDVRHTDFRIVAGMRGDPIPGISYDMYWQTGHTLRSETYFNDFSVNRLNLALDAVAVDANGNVVAPGTPGSTVVCRGTITGNPIATGCVPFNIFQAGGVTPDQLTFLETPGFQRGTINENIAHADITITGDQFGLRSPWSDTGIGANIGVEYRKESLDFKVDQEFATGDLAGQGGPTPAVSGQFDVREAFAEVQIPLIEHNIVDELSFDGAYRKSTYHVGGNDFGTNTYKLEARFAPIRDIRFRASYNRAVRAPNIVELFSPQAIGLSGTVDPCANQPATGAPTATLAQCQLSGVTSQQFGNIFQNPANQLQALFGGNANLKPETADTWTAGVILQPRFVPNLAVTVDYFNIHVKNIIGSLGFDQVLNGCMGFDGAPQNSFLCQFVHRAPNSGSLFLGPNAFVILTNINQPGLGLRTRGIDFNASYSRHLGSLGTFNASFTGTRLLTLQNPLSSISCAGFFGGDCDGLPDGGVPNPKWRHVMRVGLTMPNGLGASIRWRHFSSVDAAQFAGPAEEHFDQQNYFDLTLTARMAQRLNLRLGVNNIFDREPPLGGGNIPAGFGNGNTFPQVYDALGRFFFAGATVDF